MSVESSKKSASQTDRRHLFIHPVLWAIRLYRSILSPTLASLTGASCRYYPSCSQYAEDALRKYGLLRGSMIAVKRLLRCHPWHEGGYDPVQ